MDRSHIITCKSQAHNIFSSCQGFRSSSSGSFSGSSSVSSSGGFSSDGSKSYGSNSYGSSSNGYTSNSGSGSSYSNRGGGNFRKSFGGSSSLAQVLATRSSSGSDYENNDDNADKSRSSNEDPSSDVGKESLVPNKLAEAPPQTAKVSFCVT